MTIAGDKTTVIMVPKCLVVLSKALYFLAYGLQDNCVVKQDVDFLKQNFFL